MNIRFLFVVALSLCAQFALAQIKQVIPEVTSLDITDRLWVTVIPSDSSQVEIKGELADKVEIIIAGNSLRLKMKAGFLMKGNQAQVMVYSPSLNRLTARKGSELYVEQEELQGDSLFFTSLEGAKIRAKVGSNVVEAIAGTGASIDLLGSSQSLSATATAGASIFAKDLQVKTAFARLNAGGKIEVNASESADVETRMGGSIEVYGKPAQTKQRKIAGGKINFH